MSEDFMCVLTKELMAEDLTETSVEVDPSEPMPPGTTETDLVKVKEEGNAAFKAQCFPEAIEHYTREIELDPSEPTYLTNRAAAYMALKCFKPVLADCQHTATLQAAPPSPKTLIHLACSRLSTVLPHLCCPYKIECSHTQHSRKG